MITAGSESVVCATSTSKARSGFTLIELLIVVVVIVLLAGLLLPSLVGAKMAAKRINCVNNQRQLASVWVMYAGDNSDRLVANGMANPPTQLTRFWVQGVFINAAESTNETFILDPSYALFAQYLQTTKVYVCPSDSIMVKVNGQNFPRLRSYSLNAYMGWEGPWDDRLASNYKMFRKHSEIAAAAMPGGAFLFQDVNENSICWPYFGVRMDRDIFFNFPSSLHNRGGVLSFADGHVERHRWHDPRTIAAYSPDYHQHYDPSDQNVDLAWMRERTTVR